MSTWSDAGADLAVLRRPATVVLRGAAADVARPARMDVELRSTPFASAHVVDARLTDPHLQDVVERAASAAAHEGRARGYDDGYAAGLAAGREQAAVEAAQAQAEQADAERARAERVTGALQVLAQVERALASAETTAVAHVEDAVVDLALQISAAVLGREVAACADPGRDALARALALVPPGSRATARLHPDDVAALTAVEQVAAGCAVTVVADAALQRGDCVVEAAGRTVDARTGAALERVAAVLR